MAGETAAVNGVNYAQQYANLIGMSDLAGSINGYSNFAGDLMSNPLSMNGSIYGGMGGYGYSNTMANLYNSDPVEYLKKQQEIDKQQIANQVDIQTYQNKMVAGGKYSLQAPEDAVTRQIGLLQRAISENDQNLIKSEYDNLIVTVTELLKDQGCLGKDIDITNDEVNRKQVKTWAEKLYSDATGGSLTDDLERHGDSELGQGLKEGFFGLGFIKNKGTSCKDNMSYITGSEVNDSDKATRWVGRALGFVATAASLLLLRRNGSAIAHSVGKGFRGLQLRSAQGAVANAELLCAGIKAPQLEESLRIAQERLGLAEAKNIAKDASWQIKHATRRVNSAENWIGRIFSGVTKSTDEAASLASTQASVKTAETSWNNPWDGLAD